MTSNRKLRVFGKLYSKLDPERIAEFNHKGRKAMTRVLKPILENLRENISEEEVVVWVVDTRIHNK